MTECWTGLTRLTGLGKATDSRQEEHEGHEIDHEDNLLASLILSLSKDQFSCQYNPSAPLRDSFSSSVAHCLCEFRCAMAFELDLHFCEFSFFPEKEGNLVVAGCFGFYTASAQCYDFLPPARLAPSALWRGALFFATAAFACSDIWLCR